MHTEILSLFLLSPVLFYTFLFLSLPLSLVRMFSILFDLTKMYLSTKSSSDETSIQRCLPPDSVTSIFNLYSSSVFTSDFFVCCTFSVLVHFMLNYDLFIYLCFPPDSEVLEERDLFTITAFHLCISSVHHTARHMLGTQHR